MENEKFNFFFIFVIFIFHFFSFLIFHFFFNFSFFNFQYFIFQFFIFSISVILFFQFFQLVISCYFMKYYTDYNLTFEWFEIRKWKALF